MIQPPWRLPGGDCARIADYQRFVTIFAEEIDAARMQPADVERATEWAMRLLAIVGPQQPLRYPAG